jgi:anion-transporting  ArsA/GET3 family ATPase
MSYDTIVVDMPATGHALAMFRTPKGMADAIQIGPIAQHSGEIDRLLRDPAMSGLVVVTLLEELPIAETEEFVSRVTNEFQMPVQVVANRLLDLPLTEAELTEISKLGATELSNYAGGIASQLKNQNAMIVQLNEMQTRETLQRPVKYIPRFLSLTPREMVQATKEALRDLWMRS